MIYFIILLFVWVGITILGYRLQWKFKQVNWIETPHWRSTIYFFESIMQFGVTYDDRNGPHLLSISFGWIAIDFEYTRLPDPYHFIGIDHKTGFVHINKEECHRELVKIDNVVTVYKHVNFDKVYEKAQLLAKKLGYHLIR